jgi:superfamily II DNA or RNA helicase
MTSLPDTSSLRPPTGSRCAVWWPEAPRIVAESLSTVPDPLRTSLRAGPAAAAAAVARALTSCLAPPEALADAPAWLLPGQHRGFRRVLAALDRHRGAVLADPVGSGKTYIALAVASALLPARQTACLVPATLADQWRGIAQGLGVPVAVGTHEQASRGRLPDQARGLVIIDESHHFRNPRTRRYRHVAPWLAGRPVLLLSATPIVNRLDDLTHQLLLGVRDDALLADGVPSLRAALAVGACGAALGQVVFEDTGQRGPRPERASLTTRPTREEQVAAAAAWRRIAALTLSAHFPIAALVRGVLGRALASSPAALAAALRRYRHLLLHARDAREAGRRLTRAELRAFAGEAGDQLVLWELLPDGSDGGDLALDDLELIDGLIAHATADAAADDPKVTRLRLLLADGRPSLIFVTSRSTVRYLRDRLCPPPVAWCTGERAGLGHAPAPRRTVLEWFRSDECPVGPSCLVVTDVAAEGLDLRRAARVVHYDLPWTPMRLEQREGRAVRLGSARRGVDVVRFEPPDALDAALKLNLGLARKAALPGRAGLGQDGLRLWRWRSILADQAAGAVAVRGVAAIRVGSTGPGVGLLAGYELFALRQDRLTWMSAVAGWLDPAGRWTEDPGIVSALIVAALRHEQPSPVPVERIESALDRLAKPIREHLSRLGARRWNGVDPDPCARTLAVRLSSEVRGAARRRDAGLLARLERALGFVSGGHTAGEALLVQRLADAAPPELGRMLGRLPSPSPRWEGIEVRITGLILFER